jgi:hypothetical protein
VNISAFKAFQQNWDMSANRSILQTARTLRRRHKIFSPRPGGRMISSVRPIARFVSLLI